MSASSFSSAWFQFFREDLVLVRRFAGGGDFPSGSYSLSGEDSLSRFNVCEWPMVRPGAASEPNMADIRRGAGARVPATERKVCVALVEFVEFVAEFCDTGLRRVRAVENGTGADGLSVSLRLSLEFCNIGLGAAGAVNNWEDATAMGIQASRLSSSFALIMALYSRRAPDCKKWASLICKLAWCLEQCISTVLQAVYFAGQRKLLSVESRIC